MVDEVVPVALKQPAGFALMDLVLAWIIVDFLDKSRYVYLNTKYLKDRNFIGYACFENHDLSMFSA
ncbi:hypothetical protein [Marinobacter alexandrii]|uniref:hypothetical protein n=1 Tax=Marinobacter alexandrii TaxID=2570351 RepID=UPI001107BA7C|nr:hypothetical protein [Marinobacter alexandrii]